MSDIMLFSNPEFGDIRTTSINDEVWFVAKDIALALGYSNPNDAINRHIDSDDRVIVKLDTPGGLQEVVALNESGLYSLIMSSRLESARRFKRWVTSEVLPSIRKHGIYATPKTLDEMKKDPQSFIKLLRDYADEMEKRQTLEYQVAVQNQQILEMQPKVTYYEMVLQCKNAIPITQIAKDYGLTAHEMNTKLNELGVQYHIRKTWVLYKDYADKGYTRSITHWFCNKYGRPQTNIVTQWTQAGRLFIYDLLKQNGILPLCER